MVFTIDSENVTKVNEKFVDLNNKTEATSTTLTTDDWSMSETQTRAMALGR